MRSILASSFLLATTLAIAVPSKVNYADHKVVRVKDDDQAEQLIQQYSLATWVKGNGNVDVVVPPGVTALDGLDSLVMHDNLGKSIAKEANYDAYAGNENLRPIRRLTHFDQLVAPT